MVVLEEALAQSSASERVADALPIGLTIFDGGGRLSRWNRRFVALYRLEEAGLRPGVTLAELLGQMSAAGAEPAVIGEILPALDGLVGETKPRSWLTRLPDGRRVRVHRQPLAEGGWVTTHDDVTVLFGPHAVVDSVKSVQALIDLVPDSLWVKDADSRFVFANDATARMVGIASGRELIGKGDSDIHSPELAAKFAADERRLLQSGHGLIDFEEYVIAPDGNRVWLASTKVPLRDEQGRVIGLVGISRDITQRKLNEELRDGQAAVLEMIALAAPLADILDRLMRLMESQLRGLRASILLLDQDGRRLRHGAAPSLPADYVRAIDGIEVGPSVGSCGTAVYRREQVIVEDIQANPLWADFRELAAGIGARACWSTPLLAHDAEPLGAFGLYAGTVRAPTDAEMRLIAVATRIAGIAIERKRAEDRIHFMAKHDALTGLPNRSALRGCVEEAQSRARAFDRRMSVGFIDLDNFKEINDSLGHGAGDAVLMAVAERLRGRLGLLDTAARLGGDEFVVVLADLPKSDAPIAAAFHEIKAAIGEPVDYAGHEVRVSCSIGVVNFPEHGEMVDDLLVRADAAMYRAKEAGRDTLKIYTPDMNRRVQEKYSLREALRGALQRDELVLFYQPQVDLGSRRIVGAEALIRWRHRELGLVSPDRFIPLAEETGLIGPIGEWVVRQACRQNQAWQDAGMPPIRVSVNVSPRQFRNGALTSQVAEALRSSGLAPKYLELELTESVLMHDIEFGLRTMRELRALGVLLAIDDFGTGYSNLSALKTFPVARLKIDRSFVEGLPSDADNAAVAGAVIALGRKMNLEVVAEGVESAEQAAALYANGCHEAQGYLFGKPVPPEEFECLLRGELSN